MRPGPPGGGLRSVLRSTIITIRIPRPISAQERIPHQFIDFCVLTSTPEPIRLPASLTGPAGGREINEEDSSETPQNAPISLLESSEEDGASEDAAFLLGVFAGVEDAFREEEEAAFRLDALLDDDGTGAFDEDEAGGALELCPCVLSVPASAGG